MVERQDLGSLEDRWAAWMAVAGEEREALVCVMLKHLNGLRDLQAQHPTLAHLHSGLQRSIDTYVAALALLGYGVGLPEQKEEG